MKLSKRFSLLKKSLGLALLTPCILVCVSCNNLTSVPTPTMTATASKTLSAPVFPEHTKNDDGSLIDNITYGERYYTVSQGLKRKISFSWNAVEIAKYYEVFAAQNINDDFVKVGETDKAEFEDSVASGATFYYKVRAVSNKGQYSDFSSIVKGTSLATPAVTDISITDTSATVFWYMGNVGIDSYAKNLVYEIHAKGEIDKVATVKAWNQEKQSIVEEYTFDGLGGNVEYTFQVFAYITSEQDSVEKSPEVSKKTLALYTPVSPEFTATQGESINYIKLFITLPTKIQVNTSDSSGTEKDFDYPICFEIQRKRSTEENWKTIVPCLYYNATTTAPASDTAYDAYKEGNVIEYEDKTGSTSASIARGAKYDYRILSCIDRNYATVKRHAFNAIIKSKESLANTAQGWAAARPEFRIKNYNRELDPNDNTKVQSVSLGFDVAWNDMGKADDYKYAIEYNRTYNDGGADKTELGWITDTNGNIIINSIEEISAIEKKYDVEGNTDNVKGFYKYTLYIFPAKYIDSNKIKDEPLAAIEAPNTIGVDRTATDPYRDLKAEGGWTDHTLLTWTVEAGVAYSIDWKQYDPDTNIKTAEGTITSDQLKDANGVYTGRYEHYVSGGYKYIYEIHANASNGNTDQSDIPEANTLGTPVVDFTANSYTDITISWKQVIAAEKYQITLGSANVFGNGVSFVLNMKKDANGNIIGTEVSENTSGITLSSDYDAPTNIISLTISKPYGYNDATLSGKSTPLVVEAQSGLDAQNNIKGKSPFTKSVWTIGPAAINLKGTKDFAATDLKTDQVKIEWKKLDGAKGYAVYRMRPALVGSIKTDGSHEGDKPDSFDAYFVSQSGIIGTGNATVSLASDGTFTLTDTYKKAATTNAYDMNQQYLALGIPFTYTVIPILEENATAIDNLSQIKPTGEEYKNIASAQKIGYTTGFGIELEATKAEYPNKVVLNWKLPPSATEKGKTPTLFFRKKGSTGTWVNSNMPIADSKTNSIAFTPTDVGATPEDDDSIQALEYAITYSGSMNSSDENSKDAAYVSYLSDKYDKRITGAEIRSVGYMFNLPDITYAKITSNNEDYSETLQWHLYNWNNDRVIGGDVNSYSLTAKNLNFSAADWPIYEYDKTGAVTANPPTKYSWYDITPKSSEPSDGAVTVEIKPGHIDESSDTGTHDGLLKVQRDYKHYYTLTTSRTFTNRDGDEVTINTSSKATLYRKITNDEFAKCVTLIVADAFHKKGGANGTLKTLHVGDFTMTTDYKDGSVPVVYYLRYKFTSFQNIFAKILGQSGEFTSAFTISSDESDNGYAYAQKDMELGSNTITVKHETGLNSYQGYVTLAAGEYYNEVFSWYKTKWKLSLTYKHDSLENEMTKNISDNQTDFKQWFPFALNGDLGDQETDGTDSRYPTMNGTWWEVRQK